jgi:hypothetical protein
VLTGTNVKINTAGHLRFNNSSAPTATAGASACGTSPSVAGSDSAMTLTIGTGPSGTSDCTVTFHTAWATQGPRCIAQNETQGGATRYVFVYSTATTNIHIRPTAAGAFTAGDIINILCFNYY